MTRQDTDAIDRTDVGYEDMLPEEFHRYSQHVMKWISSYLQNPRAYPVFPLCNPGDLQRELPPTGPASGESMEAILADFEQQIIPRITHWNHPNFHAYFTLSSSGAGILGELLTAALT